VAVVKGAVTIEPLLLLLSTGRSSWLAGRLKGFALQYRKRDSIIGARGKVNIIIVARVEFYKDGVIIVVLREREIIISLRLLSLRLDDNLVIDAAGSSLIIFINNILMTLIYAPYLNSDKTYY
jgi:hypothetical protein